MTVIFPGGDFLEFISKTVKNKFLAGNIPVIKVPTFLRKERERREEGVEMRRRENRLLCTCRAPDHMQTPQSWTSRLLISALHSVCWRERKREEKEEEERRERGRQDRRRKEQERKRESEKEKEEN